ncbi:hypothetical protein [Aeromicrobium ginsengisoli]|uniref:Uncharacterized protein n=1 Tax=Aeromicrobium ginsengisoli TaxID=363867 RepID=A0A5M4F9N5_9ACTN|nr:hypothetical protein [Aeromicrobium ginsengisoli]KAA1394398.1 hypothetical protein ESP70_019585 [Aeromicrobium ginsengisoli]
MRGRRKTLLAVAMLAALSGCSGEPYGDEKLRSAVKDVDHISSVNGTCSQEGPGSWSCSPEVRMSDSASANDIASASDRVIDMLDPERGDTARITVGQTGDRGAAIELTARSKDTQPIADAARQVLDLDTPVKAQFRELEGQWLAFMSLEAGSFSAFVEHGQMLLDMSGAAHLRFASKDPEILGEADRGAWPQAELDVLAAVQKVTAVRTARLDKDFLSIVVRSKAPQARKAAKVAGSAAIQFVDITTDPDLDLYGLKPEQAATVAPLLRQVRREPGFRDFDVSEGGLEITTDTLAQARSIDQKLHAGLAREHTTLRVTYRAHLDSITVERGPQGEAWLDTAATLGDAGLFDAITITRVDDGLPQVDVTVRPSASPRRVGIALARSWHPERPATFRVVLPGGDIFFDGAERIKLRPQSDGSPEDSRAHDDVVAGWTEGRDDP